ncbi:uncharacterized protein LOC135209865 isoform X2 [Macrobrachium nipponense]|uniref:uncharacterized protein LOC135209865 isoform X2 n=1 Tax=Macrobrachium nipponense TaxID=159736 RepID=UPI0030C81ACF
MMLHANTILYGLLSLSTNHFTKVAFKLPVAVDPFMVKVFYTLLLGFLADFISPLTALLVPQVTCLVTGFLLSLQVFPQHMAFIAVYLPQLNSGLIGTQLLMKLSKPSESFAAGLSRINCFYCLTDLFSPWLLKVVTRNIGFTLSYQIMTFSSFVVLVGVLYLFHTNHRKDAYHQHEISFFKSLLIKLFFSIPVAFLLPRFQYGHRSICWFYFAHRNLWNSWCCPEFCCFTVCELISRYVRHFISYKSDSLYRCQIFYCTNY